MKFKDGDRVESVYHDSESVGTVKVDGDEYLIIYDNEPDVEYQILDDGYLEPIDERRQGMISVDNLGVVEVGFELDLGDGNKQLFHQRRRCVTLCEIPRNAINEEIIHHLRKAFETAMRDLEYTISLRPEYKIKIDNFVSSPPIGSACEECGK